ncbi:hypothetical protein PR048_022921 [Dryococelus australis]|uniref:Uncharacterized protein n=1 Tax=Dryococelus australis TaxID=614101 RepID=A0ABQ9GSP8_9NEOP|nr:hypothetical protein PR048_022921 [Dryococelus australis]
MKPVRDAQSLDDEEMEDKAFPKGVYPTFLWLTGAQGHLLYTSFALKALLVCREGVCADVWTKRCVPSAMCLITRMCHTYRYTSASAFQNSNVKSSRGSKALQTYTRGTRTRDILIRRRTEVRSRPRIAGMVEMIDSTMRNARKEEKRLPRENPLTTTSATFSLRGNSLCECGGNRSQVYVAACRLYGDESSHFGYPSVIVRPVRSGNCILPISPWAFQATFWRHHHHHPLRRSHWRREGMGNGLCWGSIPGFAWSDFGKPWKAEIMDGRTGNRTRVLPNTSPVSCHLAPWIWGDAGMKGQLARFSDAKIRERPHRESSPVRLGTLRRIPAHHGAAGTERLARSPPIEANRPGHRIFASGNRAGRCRCAAGFLGDLLFPPPLHSGVAPYPLQSSSLALKTSLLRATQISSLTHPHPPAWIYRFFAKASISEGVLKFPARHSINNSFPNFIELPQLRYIY